MSGFLTRRSLRKALLSKEGLIVLLAFILTAGVYGTLFLSLMSMYRREPAARLTAPASLFFYDGCVWRLFVPLPAEVRDVEVVGVRLTIGDVNYSVSLLRSKLTYGSVTIVGSLTTSIASGAVSVVGVGSVDLVVYVDPDGRLSIVVDDDLDGLMDDSYLVKFIQGLTFGAELSLSRDDVLPASRGTDISLDYLDIVLAASASASPLVVVRETTRSHYIPVVELVRNFKRAVAYLVSSEGGEGLVVVLPLCAGRGGVELSLEIVTSRQSLEALVTIPAGLVGSGKVVVSTR